MKGRGIIFILAIILAIGLVYLYFFNEDSPPVSKDHSYLVTTLSSEVSLKVGVNSGFEVITSERTATNGSAIKTSLTGRALLEDNGETVTIVDRNSELTIKDSSTPTEKSLSLISGNVWSRVEKTLEQGEFYEIETSNAVATVRGTSFGTFFKDGSTTVFVSQGKVQILARDSQGNTIMSSESLIGAGQKGTVDSDLNVTISSLDEIDLKNEWYIFNNQKDVPPSNKEEGSKILPEAVHTETINGNIDVTEEEPTSTSTNINVPRVPIVESIRPQEVEIYPGESFTLLITGKNLTRVESVFFGTIPSEEFLLRTDTELSVQAPLNLEEGVYDVSIVDFNLEILTQKNALNISYQELQPNDTSEEPLPREPTSQTEPQ